MKRMGRYQFSIRQLLALLAIASLAMVVLRWRTERINGDFRQAIAQSDLYQPREKPLLQSLVSQAKSHRSGLIRRLGLEKIARGKIGWDASGRSNLVWRSDVLLAGGREVQLHLFAGIPDFKNNVQRQTLVVTDSQHRLLHWRELADDSYFEQAMVVQQSSRIVLAVQGWQKSGGGRRGVRKYTASHDKTERLAGIEWREKEFNQRAWRSWLQQRWKISMRFDRVLTDHQERIGQE